MTNVTHPDLSTLYDPEMECQVNVAQDNGERIEGDYKGRQWHGWTDGVQQWKSFRIPFNANSEPSYEDTEMSYDLASHAEGIGMTGWNWKDRISKWVAYDFDAIVGHSDKHNKKLTSDELSIVKESASEIPWVTVRSSTGGKGLHLYVFLDPPIPTANHTEHAALGRAILGLMSAYVGFDFKSKVDICGGNMWVWHRKMAGTDGLSLIKQGIPLDTVPPNWREHIKVVSGRKARTVPSFVEDKPEQTIFEELSGQRTHTKLDDEHKALIKYLADNGAMFWWDSDHHMLVCHTFDLKMAHQHLNMKGVYNTLAAGKERGHDINCFAYPLRRGAWTVRRYSQGVQEHESWNQDGAGWTYCYLNRYSDLATAARTNGGMEDEGSKFVFRFAEQAQNAARVIGADIELNYRMAQRKATLKMHKDGSRVIVEIDKDDHDTADDMPGWLQVKGKWRKIFNTSKLASPEPDVGNYDDLIRHLVNPSGVDAGWVIKSDDTWHDEPLTHVRAALDSMGLKPNESKVVVGDSVVKPWKLVICPFQPEYIGDRQWNRDAPQFRFLPNLTKDKLTYEHWSLVLEHCGSGLDQAISENEWCKRYGIKKGADYLKCWIASLFQKPTEPLPYLFLYGPQGSGKSILHEGLSLLFSKGYKRADVALKSGSNFNGELENAVLCVVEETDLNQDKSAYNRIKDWVTALQISIHKKGETPYQIQNVSHWIQCSNERKACPVFTGDTRITFLYVPKPEKLIPKAQLLSMLEKEAPDFLGEVLKLEIPPSDDRLNLPVIETDDKTLATDANKSVLEIFCDECCYYIPGALTPMADAFEAFMKWCDPNERHNWSKIKMGREIPSRFPKGRNPKNAVHCFGNMSLTKDAEKGKELVVRGEYLREIEG